jgi:hypothetical protein
VEGIFNINGYVSARGGGGKSPGGRSMKAMRGYRIWFSFHLREWSTRDTCQAREAGDRGFRSPGGEAHRR